MHQKVDYDPEKDELSQHKQRSVYQTDLRIVETWTPLHAIPEHADSCYSKQNHAQSLQGRLKQKQAEADKTSNGNATCLIRKPENITD